MNVVARFFTAPQRTVQVIIWALLAAVVLTAVPLAGTLTAATGPDVAAATHTVAAEHVVLADNGAPAPIPETAQARTGLPGPEYLLPAYRWRNATALPNDFGVADTPLMVTTAIANLMFSLAGWLWWLLLAMMSYSLSIDVIVSFAAGLNQFFASTFSGLSGAGLTMAVAMFAVLAAALLVMKGKFSQGVKSIFGAVLVLALLQGLGTAAAGDASNAGKDNYYPATGTPAWLAVKGNEYVNDAAYMATSVFGATSGLTQYAESGGTAGGAPGEGATCTAYVANLYSTYADAMRHNQATASALSMVSYMWQRSMYDTFTQAAFGSNKYGDRMTCHWLERFSGYSPEVQRQVALGGNAEGSPYAGIGVGPFKMSGDGKKDQAALMAWSICRDGSGPTSLAWPGIYHFQDANKDDGMAGVCNSWWTSTEASGLTDAVPGALNWTSMASMMTDTVGSNGDQSNPEGMVEVRDTMLAYWGHNGGARFMAGTTGILTAGLYGAAFGAPAIGVLLSQFLLLFLLIVLPWGLLMLALPGKGGERHQSGKKLVRLTAMALGTKLIFLAVMGATLTLMSALFSMTRGFSGHTNAHASSGYVAGPAVWSSGMGDMFWSLMIPLVSIVAMRMVLKGVGLGNLMGLKGAMGFATAAVKQGRDGASASKFLSGMRSGGGGKMAGKMKGQLSQGRRRLSDAGKSHARNRWSARSAERLLSRNGTGPGRKSFLENDLAQKLSKGELSAREAARQQNSRDKIAHLLNAGAPEGAVPLRPSDELAARVAKGELTAEQAAQMTRRLAALAPDETGEGHASQLAAAGDSAAGAGPVFDLPGGEQLSHGDVLARQESRRAALQASGGEVRTAAQWQAANIQALGTEAHQLMANVRADGSTAPLSVVEVLQAGNEARANVHEALHGKVLVGATGLPPVLSPSVDSAGRLTFSEKDLQDAGLAREVLSNPLNFLPPEITTQRANENDHEYHARMNLTMVEAGLRDVSGRDVNMIVELDVDPADDRAVVELAQTLKISGALPPAAQLTPEAVARINATVSSLTEGLLPDADSADVSRGKISAAQDVMAQAEARVQELAAQISTFVRGVNVPGKPWKYQQRDQAEMLSRLESSLPEIADAIMSAQMSARFAQPDDSVERQQQVAHYQQSYADTIAGLTRDIRGQVAQLRLSGGDTKGENVSALAQSFLTRIQSELAQGQNVVREQSAAIQELNAEAAAKYRGEA